MTFNNRQREGQHVSISLSLQDVLHEGHVVSVGQWDLAVAEVLLQAAVKQVEQQLVGQAGGALGRLFVLHYDAEQRQTQAKKFSPALLTTSFRYCIKCLQRKTKHSYRSGSCTAKGPSCLTGAWKVKGSSPSVATAVGPLSKALNLAFFQGVLTPT